MHPLAPTTASALKGKKIRRVPVEVGRGRLERSAGVDKGPGRTGMQDGGKAPPTRPSVDRRARGAARSEMQLATKRMRTVGKDKGGNCRLGPVPNFWFSSALPPASTESSGHPPWRVVSRCHAAARLDPRTHSERVETWRKAPLLPNPRR
jgi:hypothetical protein